MNKWFYVFAWKTFTNILNSSKENLIECICIPNQRKWKQLTQASCELNLITSQWYIVSMAQLKCFQLEFSEFNKKLFQSVSSNALCRSTQVILTETEKASHMQFNDCAKPFCRNFSFCMFTWNDVSMGLHIYHSDLLSVLINASTICGVNSVSFCLYNWYSIFNMLCNKMKFNNVC